MTRENESAIYREYHTMKTLILAGGSGTRLFPLSRTCYPKQFIPLFENESLFQKTVQRALLFSEPEEVYVVTNAAHRFLVADQLAAIGAGGRVLVEPEGKNTLPAIVYGMTALDGEDAVVAVLPSDQLVTPDEEYTKAFRAAAALAKDRLVTFGITPTSPHTGYGYIRPGDDLPGGHAVGAFVEKPDQETAEAYLRDGYLWNSGMFLFSSALFMAECRRLAPAVAEAFANHSSHAFSMRSTSSECV
ncbi:mannose-1-phosphate guanylyltransferase [Methanofollis formosanus]|nr:mannose-1-phosphate guanylyltransferase [Methanofollis formosanus]